MSDRHFQDDSFDLQWMRSAIDLAICFVIAVIVLRAFVLEGYLISTGSMAPGLLGFHRRIVCPSCQHDFAFGVSFDESAEPGTGHIAEPDGTATCPNCGQIHIEVAGVPNSHGDQLLVHKHLYDFRRPNRWETIVFRSPEAPGEAYVKRVVGLPGERIRIVNGDVYINGEIARKTFEQQVAMRIPVNDLHHLADEDGWQMPWDPDNTWEPEDGAFRLKQEHRHRGRSDESTNRPETESGTQWIRFRNWRWSGGHHLSETPLSVDDALTDWKTFLARYDALPITWLSRVDYDEERQVLRCEGVMPDDLQRDLLNHAVNDEFRRAVYRLAALSHLAPVTDRYGYNAMVTRPEYVVSDLMLRTQLTWTREPSVIRVQIPVGANTFGLLVRPHDLAVELMSIDEKSVIRSGHYSGANPETSDLPEESDSLLIEVSNFDRQIIVAINGTPVFDSFEIQPDTGETALEASVSTIAGQKMDAAKAAQISIKLEQQKRWALGASDGDVRVTDLALFRDVFYTPGRKRNAVESEYTVPEAAYFVQGDNSPVSSDSRNWVHPCVPHFRLIGKPFLVHLPSRPAVLQFGEQQWPVRIPDWPRIRYIR